MHLFHKWTAWSAPYKTDWITTGKYGGQPFEKWHQKRTCEKCQLVQVQSVSAS